MCEECEQYLPVARMFGRSGFGNPLGHVEDEANVNIQEIISLGGSLMWNNAAIYGGRMELIFL